MLTLYALDGFLGGRETEWAGFRLREGTPWPDDRARPATIVLKHPGAPRAMFLQGSEVALAEAYLCDDFDIEGDVEAVFDPGEALAEKAAGWIWKVKLVPTLLRLPPCRRRLRATRGPAQLRGRQHSIERDRQAIAYHYDVSNDFYALWLDRHMIYSCAYFGQPDWDLDTAQEAKLAYPFRKLRLKPGQRLLDIGCGWGGLVMYAVEHHGVAVDGITLSQSQAELANARLAEKGLSDRWRVLLQDYREVDESKPYDALVSVGMFEHVGPAFLKEYFAKACRLTKSGGVFLNHVTARGTRLRTTPGRSFNDTYVFPDGELVPINLTLQAAESAGFEVRDVESLRKHHALTLRHWVQRLEANHQGALQHVEEATYRVWRLYMSGSAHGFTTGRLNVYQALLVKPDGRGASGLPLTRADWYRP